ncbi:hypothetical protein VB602_05600 [Vibrio parahaemolyticus]|nr:MULTISPECIES: hypothetical protein [Vibrio]EJL6790232.1 hypothetical protein [Vibrio alginolyticus]MBO0152167.1 hypothetical protein [Vibrio parahaemolyticus]MCF7372221.1 hypothetical protein [Vibrio sp. J2-3(2022)]MCR9761607.1 hypothetical protein [Vibrio parahaemolyticus]MDF5027565.1 hypothetical protein [Vibrio parahaemolyticus]
MSEANCKCWTEQKNIENETLSNDTVKNSARVPWSSASFGSTDLVRLYQQGPSILVGLIGAENSGKTTFLASIYLLLISGSRLSKFSFCGSETLGAWEAIAAYCRFNNTDLPSFPPHTPRGVERTPGVLHFTLRDENNITKNILLTDSPGEWFNQWSITPDSIEAQGAKWTAQHSDAFLIFADCEKLSGTERGVARKELRMIIQRLAETVCRRPVLLVWAKSDKSPSENIRQAIQTTLNESIPHALEVEVSVDDPSSMITATGHMLDHAWSPEKAKPISEPVVKNDAFLAYRGHYELS